jgi:ABC-type microcin C transport system duplicated ATPase subunit YejF
MSFRAGSASAWPCPGADRAAAQLLVLDEPTSALDVTIQKQVLGLLQRLQRDKGLSYLLITHDVDVIRAMAHDVMVMKDGEVLEAGPLAHSFQPHQAQRARCWMRQGQAHQVTQHGDAKDRSQQQRHGGGHAP